MKIINLSYGSRPRRGRVKLLVSKKPGVYLFTPDDTSKVWWYWCHVSLQPYEGAECVKENGPTHLLAMRSRAVLHEGSEYLLYRKGIVIRYAESTAQFCDRVPIVWLPIEADPPKASKAIRGIK